MKLLFCYLFLGYLPKWNVIDKRPLTTSNGARGERYVLQCEQTGKVTFKDVI